MKSRGRLTVVGTLDISQFWPATKGTNSSDGDTVHLGVNPASSFLWAPSPTTTPKPIKTFLGAFVNDHGRNKKVITSKNEIKIRLQGIDTPELHFPVMGKWHPSKKGTVQNEFRQPFGASAAKALHDHLAGFVASGGGTLLHATFVTQIDHLRNAIDSHGRFVGDILVGTAAGMSINTWLVEQGWAYPLLYDSMTALEVQTILNAWKSGKTRAGRPGKNLQKPLQPFDSKRDVTKAALPDNGKDNLPKIFRRQATFWAEVPGPLTGAQFVQLLAKGLSKKPDSAFPTPYFLAHVSNKLDPKKRVKLVTKIGPQGQTLFQPEDLVFQEDPTTLFAANGSKVTE